MRKKIIIIVCIVFGAILFRYLFTSLMTYLAQEKRKASLVPPVTVVTVTQTEKQKSFEVPARVVSKSQIQVNARISGYLTKSYFKEGDYVKAGQVLFEIEPQEYVLAAQRARADVERVRAQQLYYDKQAIRAQKLVQKDYIARSEYDNAVSQRDAYRAQTVYAEMAYRDAMRNLSYTQVKAPVSGRVGIISVTVGNYVTLNSGALTTIYSTKPMYVTFPLEMQQYSTLTSIDGGDAHINRKVEYIFSNGDKYDKPGIQDFRDNKVDESTGTIKMRATFANEDDALISGDFGRIIIYSNKMAKVPTIPSKAIQENQEGKYVYVLDEKGLPKLVHIKTQGQDGDNTLVSEGLEIGQQVLTSGIQKVIPGTPVRIVQEEVVEEAPVVKQNIFQKIFNKINKILKRGKN